MLHDLTLTYWFWFGVATVLIILEVALGASFLLLWLGICSIVVGIILLVFPTLVWQYQWLIFSVGAMISILLWRRYLNTHTSRSDRPTLNRRSEHYIGRTFTLSEAIVNGRGKVQVEDSTWQVEGPDMPVGSIVVVVGAEGIILKVKAKTEHPF
jgi:membrane protein implicated in regulation of membrane protease activity